MTKFPVKGGPELLQFLAAFPQKVQKRAVRSALTAAAKPVRTKARELAPKRTGKMAKSIKSGSPKVHSDGTVRISVRLKGPHAFLGVMHEYGVRPHFIAAGGSGYSARILTRKARTGDGALKIGENFVSGAVFHPGHAANPFMRPALDIAAQDAVNAFGAKLRDYLKDKTSFTAPLIEVDEAA